MDLTVDRFGAFSLRWLLTTLAVAMAWPAGLRGGEVDLRGAEIRMELLSEVEAIRPGEPFRVGLRIQHGPGWHTYWRQPGIVGVPTSLAWDLPGGFRAGPIQWPSPERVKMGGLTAWGFEREVLLTVEITPPATLPPRTEIHLRAKGAWMACARTCHPGWGDFELTLPVDAEASVPVWNPENRPLFQRAEAELPPKLEGWTATVSTADEGRLRLHLQPDDAGVRADVTAHYYAFSYTPHVHSDEPQEVSFPPGGGVEFSLRPFPIPAAPVEMLEAVLECSSGWPNGSRQPFVTIQAKWLPPNP